MRAIVYRGPGNIQLESVPEPTIQSPTDAIVRLTASAICGTDLHFVRGTVSGMKPGTILGHEGVGMVEEVGSQVKNFKPGDRVVIPSTIGCGYCAYCRVGYYAQCDYANPQGNLAGTAFFGGPESTGPFQGLQAEKARVPFAHVGLVNLPDEVSDEQAISLSDIFPTGYFAAILAEIKPGDTVAVFGCGPVGQFAIASAMHLGAGRVLAIDTIASRLEAARSQGAEVVDYNIDDPIKIIRQLTGGIGVDRAIDAVGVDASHAIHGPASQLAHKKEKEFNRELSYIAPETHPHGGNWHPGDAPTQVLRWMVEVVAKAGSISIVGVYPPSLMVFPIGMAMNKNLTIKMGNCNHRKYIPKLLELVRSGVIDPSRVITQYESFDSAIEAYQAFDKRESGWLKVELKLEKKAA